MAGSEGTEVNDGGSFGIDAMVPLGKTGSVFTGGKRKRSKRHLLSNHQMLNVDKPNSTQKGANVRSQSITGTTAPQNVFSATYIYQGQAFPPHAHLVALYRPNRELVEGGVLPGGAWVEGLGKDVKHWCSLFSLHESLGYGLHEVFQQGKVLRGYSLQLSSIPHAHVKRKI